MKHYPFPSIQQFRDIVYEVKLHSTYIGKDERNEPMYDDTLPKPVLNFKGTVKLHGTNSSIVLLKDGSIQYQSRESILSINEDNSGFCNYMSKLENVLKVFIKLASLSDQMTGLDFNEYIAIYGEWCGKGINAGTAIQQLDKMFVIFGCKVDDVWIDFPYDLKEHRIFNILSFPTFSIGIDFNDPKASLDELNELALKIEEECPVGKAFGTSGNGEGVVFVGSITRPTFLSEKPVTTYYRFKCKGEKYKLKATTEKTVSLDIDKYNSVVEFVAANLSENRLLQGIQWLKENGHPVNMTSMGTYLKWCVNDVKKECKLEMEANNIDEKILGKEGMKVARNFYVQYLDKNL